jgi:hypothetical protein
MHKKEIPVDHLQHYLPEGTGPAVLDYLHQYKVHLTITRERKSILGDYRHRTNYHNHRISVNGNLNTYSFLITLLHELAHLLTFEQYGNRVAAHGREWKKVYSQILKQFLDHKIFPADIEQELIRSLHNPAAATCAEDRLFRALKKYDSNRDGYPLLEELSAGTVFRISDGRVFQKGEKLRKRFKCVELKTGRIYLFNPVYEVEEVSS